MDEYWVKKNALLRRLREPGREVVPGENGKRLLIRI